MTYTQSTLEALRNKAGSLLNKLYTEFGLVKTELDSISAINVRALPNVYNLTAGMGTQTALATAGVDIASGANATYYAVFVAPAACTITGMITYLTEAYVKDTTDAKIELKDEAGSPVTKVTYTLPAAGRAVKTTVVHTTIASASLVAGDALDLVITASGSSSGTGYARVFLRYTLD
jgi:hypothetical protein